MTIEEAKEWLRGERSHWNEITGYVPREHGAVALVVIADAMTAQAAYYRLKAEHEGLLALRPRLDRASVVAQVIEIVSETHGISADAILGPCREQHIANARHMVAYICREICKLTLTAIARGLNRDHTTVKAAVSHAPARAWFYEQPARQAIARAQAAFAPESPTEKPRPQ